MAENYLPAPIGARLRGLIATPIIAKGPATLGSAWKSHGKHLYHSFTVRKDQVDRAALVANFYTHPATRASSVFASRLPHSTQTPASRPDRYKKRLT